MIIRRALISTNFNDQHYSKPVAPEAIWQVGRPPYQSAEFGAGDSQENH